MKRINVMVNDDAKATLVDYKNEHGHKTLDEACEAFLIEFSKGNWIKTHIGTEFERR